MHNNAENILENLSPASVSRILSDIEYELLHQYSFAKIMTGFELEFYLSQVPSQKMIDEIMQINGVFEFKNELGQNQFEIVTIPQNGCVKSCGILENIRTELGDICQKNEVKITFHAFISEELPPSSLQMSVTFFEKNTSIDLKNPKFLEIVNNIVGNTAATLFMTSPTQNCFQRISNRKLAEKFKNSPTHATWGTENRTVAVRVAKIPDCNTGNRVEFRTPSPLANSYHIATSLLSSALCKIDEQCEQTFIDSYLLLENALPDSIEHAKKRFFESEIAKKIQFFYEKHAV